MSIECACACVVVCVSGVFMAYQLGRISVYNEWKLWLEEMLEKLKCD